MITLSYRDFRVQLNKHAQRVGFPLRVMFELTYGCNFKCPHCYIPDGYKNKKDAELKTGDVFLILDQLADIGCFYLGFTGGEPFLRKDIFDILWHAKKKGFQVIVYTNGSLIDEKKAGQLKRVKPNKIDITIPSLSRPSFERLTGVKGWYQRVFNGVRLLSEAGVQMGFKSCVLKGNEDEIKKLRAFAASFRSRYRVETSLMRRLDGSSTPYEFIAKTQTRIPFGKLAPLEGGCGMGPRLPDAPSARLFKCGAGFSQAAITPYGQLKLCLMIDQPRYRMDAGDLRRGGLKSAWEKLKSFSSSVKSDRQFNCQDCARRPDCRWCPAKSWLYRRDFGSCEHAKTART